MALSYPRGALLEFYLDGWTDVSTYVRQTSQVTVTRGRSDEQGDATPCKLTATLENSTGNMDPDNPVGLFYGLLGRNTPVRWGFPLARDDFADTVVDDWGAADTGEDWDKIGAGGSVLSSDWQVAAGKATHSVPAVSAYRMSLLDVSVRDAYVRTSVTLPFTDVTGGPVEPANIVLRYQDIDTYYMVRARIRTDEAATLELRRVDGSETIIAAFVLAGITHTSSQTLHVAAMIEDETIRAKAWVGAKETLDWQITAHDGVITAPGKVGVRSGVDSANTNTKPIIFSYDEFVVRVLRFSGEITSIKPKTDESHKIKTASLQASGILRRLRQGTSPAKTALEDFVVNHATQPYAYWPLDDGNLVKQAEPAAATGNVGDAIIIDGNFPTVPVRDFGTGDLSPWLNPAVRISNSYILHCTMIDDPIPAGAAWTVHYLIRFDGRYSTDSNDDAMDFGISGVAGSFVMVFKSFSYQLSLELPTGPPTIIDEGFETLFDGNLHHFMFAAEQNGTDIFWDLTMDGRLPIIGAIGSATNPGLSRANFRQNGHSEDTRERFIGHVIVYDSFNVHPFQADLYDAATGFIGELSGVRAERVALAHGIPFFHAGDLGDTPAMGPQAVGTPLDLLQECADVVQGEFYEPRGVAGVTLRTLPALYAQVPVVTLDYAAGQVAPVLEPNPDDQNTTNNVTVKRLGGRTHRAIQTTGPLNVQDPGTVPGAVGLYDHQATVNVETDAQLPGIAEWLLHLGTTPERRYPKVTVNLATPDVAANTALVSALLAADVGDRLVINNLQARDVYAPIDQIIRGYTETLTDDRIHKITFNTTPYAPYAVLELDSDTGRLESDGTFLAEDLDASETGADVNIPGGPLWIRPTGEATGTGTSLTPDYLVATDADAVDVLIGDECHLFTSAGALKQATTFTVTGKTSFAGFTNVEFSPDALVSTVSGDVLRSFPAGEFPFDVMVGGERMTVFAISGASSPQTLTVTRNVNALPSGKTHLTGARVELADPVYLGL